MQHPGFILEGKAPVEPSRGDGGGGGSEASSLSGEQRPEWLGPNPTMLPLIHEESPGPWQSESLLAESWSTMGDMDPEDAKSLDSNEGAVLAGEERSENHSSISDMVHLEREEAEMLVEVEEEERRRMGEEEDEELQTSMLSVLGGERELAELRKEEQELQAPETEGLLMSVEETRVEKEPTEFMQVVPPMALPPLPIVKLDPPSTTSTPVSSASITSEVVRLYPTQELHPPPVLAPMGAEPSEGSQTLGQSKFSETPLPPAEELPVTESQAAPEKAEKTEPEAIVPKAAPPRSFTDLPMLLCGSAALVAVVGVVAYGAVALCRKSP